MVRHEPRAAMRAHEAKPTRELVAIAVLVEQRVEAVELVELRERLGVVFVGLGDLFADHRNAELLAKRGEVALKRRLARGPRQRKALAEQLRRLQATQRIRHVVRIAAAMHVAKRTIDAIREQAA